MKLSKLSVLKEDYTEGKSQQKTPENRVLSCMSQCTSSSDPCIQKVKGLPFASY